MKEIFIVLTIICVIVSVYGLRMIYTDKEPPKWSYAVFLITLITLTAIIGKGISALFWFFPNDWVHLDEDGDGTPLAEYLGYTIGFFLTIFLMQTLRKSNSKK